MAHSLLLEKASNQARPGRYARESLAPVVLLRRILIKGTAANEKVDTGTATAPIEMPNNSSAAGRPRVPRPRSPTRRGPRAGQTTWRVGAPQSAQRPHLGRGAPTFRSVLAISRCRCSGER